MTTDSRFDALEKRVTELEAKGRAMGLELLRAEATKRVYQASIEALLSSAPIGGQLDHELSQALSSIEANLVSAAETEEELEDFRLARDMVANIRIRAIDTAKRAEEL